MPRIRTVKPEFFMDEEVAEMGFARRLLFIGLWQHCDVAGRCEDKPKLFKATIFPYDDGLDVNAMLAELEVRRMVVRYEADGKRYLWVRNFCKHQRFSGKEATTPSLIPPCPDSIGGSERETNTETTLASEAKPESNGEDDVNQEGSIGEASENPGRERRGRERIPPTPPGGPWQFLGEAFDAEEVRSSWIAFEAHRKSLGKPNGGRYSPQGLENFAGAVRNAGATPGELAGFVRFCMASGWNGLPLTALPKFLADRRERPAPKAVERPELTDIERELMAR